MEEQYILDLYNQLGGQSKFGNFEDFKDAISTDKIYQKDFHSAFGESTLGNFEDFSSLVSSQSQAITPKKKGESMVSDSEVSSSGLPSGEQPKLEEIPFSLDYQKQEQQVPFKPSTPVTQPEQKRDVSKLKEYDTTQQYDRYGVPVTQFPTAQREEYLAKPVQQIETKVKFEEKKEELEKQVPGFLKPSVETIDKNFLSRTSLPIISDLNRQYKEAGFEFSGNPADKTYLIAKAPNGQTLNINLGYFNNAGYINDISDEAERLKVFIKENSPSIPTEKVNKLQKEYEEGKQEFLTQKQIDESNKSLSKDLEDYGKRNLSYTQSLDNLKKSIDEFNAIPESQRNTPEYINRRNEIQKQTDILISEENSLKQFEKDIEAKQSNLKKSLGEYTKYKENQGTFAGGIWNSISNTISSMVAGTVAAGSDIITGATPAKWLLGKEEYEKQFTQIAKEKYGIEGDKFDDIIRNDKLTEGRAALINSELKDRVKKERKYGKEGEEGVIKYLRGSVYDLLADKSTTEQWAELKNKSFIPQAILGVSGSLPNMLMPGGWIGRALGTFISTSDGVFKEMENSPNFQNISENEKWAVAAPLGMASATLEEIGLSSLLKGTNITKYITKMALDKAGANVTPNIFKGLVKKEVQDLISNGTLKVVNGFLAEAETGALQTIAEFSIKDIYNTVKDKKDENGNPVKMFDTPDTVTEWVTDVLYGGAVEGVGGLMISSGMAAASAFNNDNFVNMDSDTFKAFVNSSNDLNVEKAFISDLKNKIASGDMTMAEGKDLLNKYRQAKGLLNSLPSELDEKDKRVALDLLSKRKKLEDKIQGKDTALSKPIQNQINNINEQLNQITENAIQKQTAGEVPVQPEARVGEEVVQGKPETGLEVTPKQGVLIPEEKPKEEVVTPEGVVEKKDIQVYRGTSTGNKSDKDGVSYHTTDRGYAAFYETGKEKPDNKALEELEALTPPNKPNKVELSTNEEIDAYVDDYISMAEDAKKFKPETKIPSREEAISELKKQNQIFLTQEEVDNENKKQEKKYNSDLEKYNQKKLELEDKAKNYLSPKKISGNFFNLGIDFSKMNPQQIFEKLKSLGISSVFKGGNFLDNYHSDLTEYARKNNIDFYDGITGGVQGSMNTAPQEIIEVSKLEQAPAEVKTPEQEADLLEELLTGKKKEPAMTPQVETMTPGEEVMTPETKAEEEMIVQPEFTEQDQARKRELEDALKKADKRKKNVMVGEVSMPKAEVKAELDTLRQKEQTTAEVKPAVTVQPEVIKEEVVAETKNLLDVPKKPFKKAVDLLGDPRQDWMYEATEKELEQSKKKDTMRGSQYYPKKITAIENAVKKGKFEKAVQDGRMSAQDAKQIIESAGLEVPKTIEDLLGKPKKKKGKKLSDTIRGFEIKGPGGLQSNIFGVPIAIWNSAVKTTAAAVDAGVAIAEALQKGANKIKDWISKNNPSNKLLDEKINNKILRQAFAGVIKTARENNVSEEGIRVYLKRNGLSDEQIDIVVKKREQKAPPTEKEVREKTTAKKVDVKEIKEIEQIVKLQEDAIKEGKKSVQEAVKEFIRLFNKSKVVTKLTRSDLNKIINLMEKVKDFDSLQKAVGNMYDIILKSNEDIIEVSEKKQKEQFIKEFKKGVREKKGDLNTKRKALAAVINDMVKKGTLTVRQANAIIKRVNFVNLDNPIMIDRLIEYAGNIFNDADYDTKMQEVRKLQNQVKRREHTSTESTVREFTSINPELIPDNKILQYIQALDDMNTRTPSYAKMNNMFDEVMSYKTEPEGFNAIKTFQKLMDKLESIALNEVKSVEDYVNLIRDINSFKRNARKLLENGSITQKQYDEAIENVGKDQAAVEKKYEKELAALKKDLVNEIKGLRPKTNPDFTAEENAMIEKYLEVGDKNLEQLAPEELYVLNDLLQNIKDGQMDYYRFADIVSKAYSKDAIQQTTEQVKKSKFDMALDKGKELLSEYESSFWEGLLGLGRVTSGALQKFIVSPVMRAIGSYEKFIQDSYKEFSNLKKKYGMNNKEKMNKLGMLTTYLQEYMAQFDPDNEGVKDIGKRDWFKEILNDTDMQKQYPSEKLTMRRLLGKVVGRGKTQLESMQKIWNSLPKDKDGNVDPKAVYDSYMANDGKFFSKKEKEFFDKVMEWKQKNTTTKQKAANELRGNPFKEMPFHMLRSRYDSDAKQIAPKASGANGMVRIEAGTGKEIKNKNVGPININFEELFIEGVEQTARDYFLSGAIQDVNNVLSGVSANMGENQTIVETITGAISEALNFEFEKSSNLLGTFLSARATMVLLDAERTVRETLAGLVSYPIRAKTISGYKDLLRGVKKMKDLLEFTQSPLRLRENIGSSLEISDGQIQKMNAFQRWTFYLAGLPERTMMVTSWMPTFRSEFKNITGSDFNMEAFKTDKAYKETYGKAIREASAVADAQTEKIIGTTAKAGQRRNIRIAPEFLANLFGLKGTVKKNTASGQIIGFFTNYPYREVTEFFNGFREAAEILRNKGFASSPEAAAQLSKPLGIIINVAVYGYLASMSYALQLMALGDDDDEERGEKLFDEMTTTKGILEDFQGNAISLLASRYGIGSKALLQTAGTIAILMEEDAEKKNYIKKLMKGSIYVDPLPIEKATEYGGKAAVVASFASYIPQLIVAADRFIDVAQLIEDASKIYNKAENDGVDSLTKKQQTQVLAGSALFKIVQLGLNLTGTSLPFYGKLKIYEKKLRTEAGIAEKTKSSEKREAYGGYKTIEEFRTENPEKYMESLQPGGSLYEYKMRENQKKMEELPEKLQKKMEETMKKANKMQ